MAVDIDEARCQKPAPGVDDMARRRTGEAPNGGDGPACYSDIAGDGGGAGAVQNTGVLNQIIVHGKSASLCSGDSVARHRRLCKSTGKLSKEEIQRSVPAFPRFLNPPPKDQNQQAQNAQQDISEVLWPKSEKLLRFSRAIVWQVYQKDSQQVFQRT